MYTEFYSIWATEPYEGMTRLNERVSELRKMNVGRIDVQREREKDTLYVTITYWRRPGDEGYEENEESVDS